MATPITSGHRRAAVRTGIFYVLVLIAMVPFVFPLYWMLASAFKPATLISANPPVFWWKPTLANFTTVFDKVGFGGYAIHSLVIALGATLVSLALGLPAAYSIARYKQYWLATSILVVRILPGIAFLIPWYIFFNRAHLLGHYASVIVVHMVGTLPLTIWIMVSFFEDVPSELSDAALIDGCTVFGVFWRIAIPIVRPGVMVAAIFAFNFSWNNFISSSLIGGIKLKTLPVIAYNMKGEYSLNWGGVMAAATIIILPMLVFTLLVQKHIVRGLSFGALKG